MANMLLSPHERSLTPQQVERLDRRRRRGQLLLVLCGQFLVVSTLAPALDRTRPHLLPRLDPPHGLLERHHLPPRVRLRSHWPAPPPRHTEFLSY